MSDRDGLKPNNPKSFPTSRRRSKRIPLEAIVHYQVDGSEFINLSSNISSEGIFIRNFSPPPVGTELRIKVQLPKDEDSVPVQLIGKVVRVVDGVGVEERGMGVEFHSVQAETPNAVRFFVNEVYELDQPARVEVKKDQQSGRYSYVPRPEDVLRLEADSRNRQNELSRLSQLKLIRAILLILVGILLGGGFVFLFFLAD